MSKFITQLKQKQGLLSCFFLVIIVLALYWPVQNYNFIFLDDNIFVIDNGNLQDGFSPENIIWALTNTDIGFWQPLMWLSLMLDRYLFWNNAGGYHWTNVLFHIASTLLLFITLKRMTASVWRSFFVAILFGIHPLHVESVAWISERKDVLSVFFWMLTMLAYDFYIKKKSIMAYLGVLVFFLLGNMSKSMVMTLPFVLLLLDYWPLKRIGFAGIEGKSPGLERKVLLLIVEKIPLILISIGFGIVTYISQAKIGALDDAIPWYQSINIAHPITSYILYISKMLWPVDLAIFYPKVELPIWKAIFSGLLIALISIFAVRRIRRNPYLFVGWGWYIISLVPVIGFFQVGSQAIADRYAYITLTGLFMILAWGGHDFVQYSKIKVSLHNRKILIGAVAALSVLALFISASIQIRYWKDDKTLFIHSINVTENNYFAFNCLGGSYLKSDIGKAVECFRTAAKLRPDFEHAHANLGTALTRQGKYKEAEEVLTKALSRWPQSAAMRVNLAVNYIEMNKQKEAVHELRKVVEKDPANKLAHINIAVALRQMGDLQGAIKSYREAIRVKSVSPSRLHHDLALLMEVNGKKTEAVFHLREALRIDPNFESAQRHLNRLLNAQ